MRAPEILGIVADFCPDREIRGQLVEHLEDEARHCRLYLRLIDIVFPASLPQDVLTEIENRLPPLVHRLTDIPPIEDWQLLDNLIQINLGEVRTCIHQRLLEPVLHAYCPVDSQPKLADALKWLASDETLAHSIYSAAYWAAWSRRRGRCQIAFCRPLASFQCVY